MGSVSNKSWRLKDIGVGGDQVIYCLQSVTEPARIITIWESELKDLQQLLGDEIEGLVQDRAAG